MKTDFSNPEIFHQLEKQAYQGTIEISDFPPVEYKYFSELRQIYYAFKFDGLSRTDAEKQKIKLFRQYQDEKNTYDNYFQFVKDWNSNIIKSELLRSQIAKTSDFKEKYRLAVECIGALTGDTVFTRTELEKLENQKGIMNYDEL